LLAKAKTMGKKRCGTCAAWAWLRALCTPVQDSKASTLREYQQALADFARESAAEVEHVSGSADLLRASQAVALLSRDKKASEVAALEGCRKLIAAFNALVDDTPGRLSERR
jgi:hypothetical protein